MARLLTERVNSCYYCPCTFREGKELYCNLLEREVPNGWALPIPDDCPLPKVPPRRLVHFSCGAASAVAAKLTLAKHPDAVIVNAYIEDEHKDNRRFLADVERWIGKHITVLRDEKYGASVTEVWRRERYIKGPNGASCAIRLKRRVLNEFAEPDDIHVIGFCADEPDRTETIPLENVEYPLIEANLTKADCLAIVERAGIQLPEMYLLGYNNANCIGCCKGGMGYWNKIRRDFPERFYQIADIQEAIGPGAYFLQDPDTKGRMKLRDLPEGRGSHKEPEISCSFFCQIAEEDMRDTVHAQDVAASKASVELEVKLDV